MSKSTTTPFDAHLNLFLPDLGDNRIVNDNFNKIYNDKGGDWEVITIALTPENGFSREVVNKLEFTHQLLEWSNTNIDLVKSFQKDDRTNSMRDIALNLSKADFTNKIVTENVIPAGIDAQAYADELHKNLFQLQPTAMVERILRDPVESPIPDKTMSDHLFTFLKNQPTNFNIKTNSVYEAFKNENAFKDIPEEIHEEVKKGLKDISRVAAMSPVPEALSVLMKANLTSSLRVSNIPEKELVQTFSKELGVNGETIAKQVHLAAVNTTIRNAQALIDIKESLQGTGIAFIDQPSYSSVSMKGQLEKYNLSWDQLFGDSDFCECDECTSVYGASAYFVDLLQFLRNNNLKDATVTYDPKSISGTVLEKLFERRPDLGCLQLTCKNTNTTLPYIDLVNEVMESYVVYKQPKPFNVAEDETSSELLSQPKHTASGAYSTLQKAVYPFTLPYHQPIDSIRIFLNYLGSSRHELIETFRSGRIFGEVSTGKTDPVLANASEPFVDREIEKLDNFHINFLDRASDAEFLGLTQEEYVILTKEAFVSKDYLDRAFQTRHTDKEYFDAIGVLPVHAYYGYPSDTEMLNPDESMKQGLTFVKDQMLHRAGLEYKELVSLLMTSCLNPNMPEGRALNVMESIQFSYRFLQTLVVPNVNTLEEKYEKIISVLKNAQTAGPLLEAMLNPDPCNTKQLGPVLEEQELEKWVYNFFERVGKIIVLENGARCIDGHFAYLLDNHKEIIVLKVEKCQLIDASNNSVLGSVNKTTGEMNLTTIPPTILSKLFFVGTRGEKGKIMVLNDRAFLVNEKGNLPFSIGQMDTCDLDTVRLIHLDGSALDVEEYDRIHRFIRLWRKLDRTIEETDKLLNGLSARQINPKLLHDLIAVKKLLDQTGLDLTKMVILWSRIGTEGETPLYKKLFLTHNLSAIDDVFKADKNGVFLSPLTTITAHTQALKAAFNLTIEEIEAIVADTKMKDELTLENLSTIYRYRLLSKAIGLKIAEFIDILPLFGNVFESPDATLAFLERWNKIDNAGFDYHQLNYIIRNYEDPKHISGIPADKLLGRSKLLYDGLNAIDAEHTENAPVSEVTNETIRAKSILLFEEKIADKMQGLVEGTNIFIADVPAGLNIEIAGDQTLQNKLKYVTKTATAFIQVTGYLTEPEKTYYKTLDGSNAWKDALTEIESQQDKLFDELLSEIITFERGKSSARETEVDEAAKILKKGDFTIPIDQVNESQPDPNTAPEKRSAFIKIFLPYLRTQLTQNFILDKLSGLEGLSKEVAESLLTTILEIGIPSRKINDVLESLREKNSPVVTDWKGYLVPLQEGAYTFIINSANNPSILLDDQEVDFINSIAKPNEWLSPVQKLKAGKYYKLTTKDRSAKDVYWKINTSPITRIPLSQLLPDFVVTEASPAFVAFNKAAMLVKGFELNSDELFFFQQNKGDFGNIDFNKLTIDHWFRLEAYVRLRNALPKTKTSILEFLRWTHKPGGTATLSDKIAELTNWKKERIEKLITKSHFNLDRPEAFLNEENLLKLQKAVAIADKTGIEINSCFDWAVPSSVFRICKSIADDIQLSIRSRHNQEDWEEIVKPLSDLQREHQKNALIAYLLQQPDLINRNVRTADDLFEYFLIDVQMDACMETSRIKQAICSVQLFIQRCFLGLEKELTGVGPERLDGDRWEWMQRYRLWEANRKVFLYPENWIESNLRDEKTPFFKELESELLQKDINKLNVEDALKAYLYKVDEVANMEVIGLCPDRETSRGRKLHVFARTRNAPYFFYYRYFAMEEENWYPWEKMQVDIPSYDIEDPDTSKITGNGAYLTPVVWNNRLLIFFPIFLKKTKPSANSNLPIKYMADSPPNFIKPMEYWEIKLGWSEYRNGKWTQKQLSKDAVYDVPDSSKAIEANNEYAQAVQTAIDAAKTKKTELDKFNAAVARLDKAGKDYAAGANGPNASALLQEFQAANIAYAIQAGVYYKADKADKDAAAEITTLLQKYSMVSPAPLPEIFRYEFVPLISNNAVGIKVTSGDVAIKTTKFPSTNLCAFEFAGSTLRVATEAEYPDNNTVSVERFHHHSDTLVESQIESLERKNGDILAVFADKSIPRFTYKTQNTIDFYHPFSHVLLGTINSGELSSFFQYTQNGSIDKASTFGEITQYKYHELKRPYAIYNWELFFHTPTLIADALSKAQHYEEAMKWYHYVFNPIANVDEPSRFWQFRPFKETNAQNVLDTIFNNLQPSTSNPAITEWRSNPFKPHLVARTRTVAYMKWVVMKYIDNLVAWGDYLFRQDTIESINQATQLYVLAGSILGPKPQIIPKRGKIKPQTYNSLLNKWDAFSNAMVELELIAPFSNQTPLPFGIGNGVAGLANIFGFGSTLYFGIPNNPKLLGYWDTIADRLFKIRHCENIEGVFRKLPLFEPAIDVGLLAKAAAQGISISSVLNDVNSSIPNYRFYYLLQKALELCNELKSLGSAMLSAMEKKDNEAMSLLRARHESSMQSLIMGIKKQQLEEATKTIDSLLQNRKSPEHRMRYYLQLIGEDAGKLPGLENDFSELANAIETPVSESGLKLIRYEKEDMEKAHAAAVLQLGIGIHETLAGILSALPNLSVAVTPLGVGASASFGGSNLGSATSAVARTLQTVAGHLTYESSNAGKAGNFLRQVQERVMQANAAGYEIKQIDKQVLAQQIRVSIANTEIGNQQKQIDNAHEIEEFLKDKYTNQELYSWMKENLTSLYHQVYELAFDLAKKAEKVFRFERGLSNSNFIQSGYWDEGYGGLLSGEKLYVGLKQLEAAYHEQRGYDYEISKHVSLRQINPLAILQLKETGKCEFDLSEILYDMDYPGHIKRRIKSVSLSLPCISGPYSGLNATLRLLSHKTRLSNMAANAAAYPETEGEDDRFATFRIPISAIALSSGQNDSGTFELNFKDERYLPFEGAGVISKWKLELPTFRQFDYDTITDCVLHVRYTSAEGGELLKRTATDNLSAFVKTNEQLGKRDGLFAVIDLKNDQPNEWHKAMQIKGGDTERKLQINNVQDYLPFFIKTDKLGNTRAMSSVHISNISLVTEGELSDPTIFLLNDDIEFESNGSLPMGSAKCFKPKNEPLDIQPGNWKLTISDIIKPIEKAFLVMRFTVD